MSREVHVRFCEGLGLQCPGLLTFDIAECHERSVPKLSQLATPNVLAPCNLLHSLLQHPLGNATALQRLR